MNCGRVSVTVLDRDGFNVTSLKMETKTHLWLHRGLLIILFFMKRRVIFLSAEKNAFFPCLISISFECGVEKLKYDVLNKYIIQEVNTYNPLIVVDILLT